MANSTKIVGPCNGTDVRGAFESCGPGLVAEPFLVSAADLIGLGRCLDLGA